MDIQYVHACVMYIASYIMKTERAMGELLKRVARTEDQLKKVGSVHIGKSVAQKAVPMKRMSRTVLFVDTNPKKDRIGAHREP